MFLPLFLAASVAPILAWSTPALFVGTLVLGMALGANVVALNARASESSRRAPTDDVVYPWLFQRRRAGAILGAVIIALEWQDGRGAILIACVQIVAAMVAARFLLATSPPAPVAKPSL